MTPDLSDTSLAVATLILFALVLMAIGA